MTKPKPFTKTQRRNVRENTYHLTEPKVCGTCKYCLHSWCFAVWLRGKHEVKDVEVKDVEFSGTCDLWEKR